MEKKTLGSFMAALRKARGLTQKDLAEQLHVSDKSVSRWERDEGTPDLSLIPVIAEIFDITADELLRGERSSSAEHSEQTAVTATPKGEKQRRRLLAVGLTRYRNQSLLSAALLGCGLLAALVGNFAFTRAAVGFYAGAAFLLVAAVLQCVWVNGAMLTVSDEEVAGEEAAPYRCQVIRLAELIWAASLTLLAALLPLVTILPDPAHTGMTADYFSQYAMVYGGIGLLICGILLWLVNSWLVKRGVLVPENEKRYFRNRALQKRCVAGLAVAAAVTFLAETALLKGWNVMKLAEYTEFRDCDSFVAFMEQEVKAPSPEPHTALEEAPIQVKPENESESQYYDQYGNLISEEEALHREVLNDDGTVLCTYQDRNESVVHIEHGRDPDGGIWFRVVTQDQWWAANDKGNKIVFVFGVLYAAEAAGAALTYLLCREKKLTHKN